MKHLLAYPDFTKSVAAIDLNSHTSTTKEQDESNSKSLNISQNDTITTIGHAVLNNSQDTSFQEEGLDSIVDPLCRLRGMDLFLADSPEEQILKQPVLIE